VNRPVSTCNDVTIPAAASDPAMLRRIAYGLMILAALGSMTGRIFAVKSRSGRTPMLSANDRSRWAAIRALVDQGTYAIDRVSFRPDGKRDPEWQSIDMVKHRGRDGREHYYSSKPTLLTTLIAGPYWVVKKMTGMTLATHPFHVIRALLLLVNVVPLAIYFLMMAWMAERLGTTSFGRLLAVATATFGTYITTFAVTLNNHLPAAIGVAATIAVAMQIGWYGKQRLRWFVLAGLMAASTAANELPALSFFCLVALLMFWVSPRQTLLGFLPAAGIVALAAVGTNYIAHGTWSTPYAHRRDGPRVATISGIDGNVLAAGTIPTALKSQLAEAGVEVSLSSRLSPRSGQPGWMLWDPQQHQRWAVHAEGRSIHVHQWDNWYDYEGSYWTSGKKQGVDLGERSKLVYAFHAFVGHHGIFSLTPIWILSAIGAVLWLRRGTTTCQLLALTMILLTLVCLGFYILLRPLEDRNYGGVSCCLRWALWLVPLWILCLVPAGDATAHRPWLRRVAVVLFFVGVLSATYNALNPWSHPWLFDYWTYLGWIRY
jgi:hypothetical protein